MNLFIQKISIFLLGLLLIVSCSKRSEDTASVQSTALPLTEMAWYAPNNLTQECTQSEGPGKLIEMMQTLQKPYTSTDEEKVGDTITVVRLDIPSEGGGVRYLRGKDRCEAYVNALKQVNKGEVDKYK